MLPTRGSDRLADALQAVRRQFPVLVLLSCLLNLLLLVTSIYMLQVYDRVLSSGSLDTLLWLTLIALFAVVIYGLLEQAPLSPARRRAGTSRSPRAAPGSGPASTTPTAAGLPRSARRWPRRRRAGPSTAC